MPEQPDPETADAGAVDPDEEIAEIFGRPKDYYLLVETETSIWERHVGLTKAEARVLRPWLRDLKKKGRIAEFTLERSTPELYESGLEGVKGVLVADLQIGEGEEAEPDLTEGPHPAVADPTPD